MVGRVWPFRVERQSLQRIRVSWWADLVAFLVLVLVLFGVIEVAARWIGPMTSETTLDLSAWNLPLYALFSLARMTVAFTAALGFGLVYGRLAAADPRLEHVLLPVLDILQSIPILSFMPGVVLALVALFPHRNLGAELAAIVLIFTSQAWNLAFSVYQSVITVPKDLREAAAMLHFTRWQRLTRLELPFALVPLLWNSVMSWAGGWFFLMASEQFTLGERSFRLPGLGAYLATAADQGDLRALGLGLVALVTVIVLVDRLFWQPLLAWSHRFTLDEVSSELRPGRAAGSWFQRSLLVSWLWRQWMRPLVRWLDHVFDRLLGGGATSKLTRQELPSRSETTRHGQRALPLLAGIGLFVLVGGTVARAVLELPASSWLELATAASISFARVMVTLIITALWTVPVGVAIGTNPSLTARVQPVVQTLASIPATALFPAIVLVLLGLPGGLQMAALVLLALGTQWYVLFNVIAGAAAIPHDFIEASTIFRLTWWQRWQHLLLPAIFPSLITGLITAAGGAWNATIVAEYVVFRGEIYVAGGLGAEIASSAATGDYRRLLAATVLMAAIVVVLNRTFWARLYRLSMERFQLAR